MTMTHKEALSVAATVWDETATHRHGVEAAIRAYIEARGLVLVPKEATVEMKTAGESWSGLPGQTWDDMLGAAPDTFEEVE